MSQVSANAGEFEVLFTRPFARISLKATRECAA